MHRYPMSALSPSSDKIARRYTLSTLEQKVQNKTALQEELGWPAEPRRPLMILPAGMSDALGGKLLKEVLPGILSLDLQLLVLGMGSLEYGSLFTEIAKERKHRIAIVPEEEEAILKMYAAADMALFLRDPSNLKELTTCLAFGVVPIAPSTKTLEPYDPIQESGTAFLFEGEAIWHCFAALVRALETHRFPFDWRTIQRHCMETVRERK